MVEMGVRDQDEINRRKVGDAQTRTTQPLQHKEPPREIRINDYALPPNLQKEARMSDESNTQLSIGDKVRLVRLTGARSYRRVAHQAPELGGALAQCRIAKSLLDHPAIKPGVTVAFLALPS